MRKGEQVLSDSIPARSRGPDNLIDIDTFLPAACPCATSASPETSLARCSIYRFVRVQRSAVTDIIVSLTDRLPTGSTFPLKPLPILPGSARRVQLRFLAVARGSELSDGILRWRRLASTAATMSSRGVKAAGRGVRDCAGVVFTIVGNEDGSACPPRPSRLAKSSAPAACSGWPPSPQAPSVAATRRSTNDVWRAVREASIRWVHFSLIRRKPCPTCASRC